MYARMDASGLYPEELQTLPQEGWLAVPRGLRSMAVLKMMVVDGQWQPRPEVPEPVVSIVPGGFKVLCEPVPADAVATIRDHTTGTLIASAAAADLSIAFLISAPGTYQLEVTAAAPWLGRTANLVMT